ncbi:type III secretion system translocon subunit SctB [Comamonas sp. NLF-1-9]|uniref:type III secretion system translocon subunit SctB n=1 Tax=Comamonas sp. NLF-1-9 TaxID=2853163 RepID=UPI001C44DE2D|nr:type III secretion system translocon subunit SctB [Comamonas sp. NLF-1-9]QXL83620.1 type III secretion system translocon subunit SctB [Comamonas sp. NLF-1-9]
MHIPGTGPSFTQMTPLSSESAQGAPLSGDKQAFSDISDHNLAATQHQGAQQMRDLAPPTTPSEGAASAADALGKLSVQDAQADIYSVMALFTKIAQDQRTSARELRQSEMQAQVDTLIDAAEEIRNAAKDRLIGAIVSGAMQIGAGAIQMGGAAMSLKASASALKDFRASQNPAAVTENFANHPKLQSLTGESVGARMSTEELSNLTTQAGSYASGADGASKMASGLGGMAGGIAEYSAAQHDAQKARLEAAAKAHEAATQQAGDVMQQMMDVLRDVRDKLNAIEQSRSETTRGIARNI